MAVQWSAAMLRGGRSPARASRPDTRIAALLQDFKREPKQRCDTGVRPRGACRRPAPAQHGSRPLHSQCAPSGQDPRVAELTAALSPLWQARPDADAVMASRRRSGSGSRGQRRWRTLMDDDRWMLETRPAAGRQPGIGCASRPPHTQPMRTFRKLTCTRNGKRCCGSLKCDQTVVNTVAGRFCCKRDGASCTCPRMLLRHLRLPRQGRHVRPMPAHAVPIGHVVVVSPVQELLRRLPRPRDPPALPVLLQRLHGRRLSVGAGGRCSRDVDCRAVLLRLELHKCLRRRQV